MSEWREKEANTLSMTYWKEVARKAVGDRGHHDHDHLDHGLHDRALLDHPV